MEEKKNEYGSHWDKYAYPEDGARFAAEADLTAVFTSTPLDSSASAAGIPLFVSDNPRGIRRVVVNDLDENTVIYGETGSMKTRAVIRPLIFSLACRGESMIVTDPKGELAADPTVRGLLDEIGYATAFLDFRDFSGDGFNILEYAYDLYRDGEKDKAAASIAAFIHALTDKPAGKNGAFWKSTSEQMLIPIVHALTDVFACAEDGRDYVNIFSLAAALTEEELECMKTIFSDLSAEQNNSTVMFRNALAGSDITTANVTVSAAAYLQPFLVQPSLTRMLSCTTFDADALYEKPTAVFIIVPDETSAYDEISGYLIDNLYSRLIDRYTRVYQHRKSPRCRVNFVCDEFCNLRINDMGPKISACRSRDIRFYLVCQSMKQLEAAYPDAAVIEGNCENILFLQSSDPTLIDHICALCGTTRVSDSGERENLVTPSMLRGLGKTMEYKEALFIRDRLVYLARLADCATYALVKKYASAPAARIPKRVPDILSFIRPTELAEKIRAKTLPLVFTPLEKRPEWFKEPLFSRRLHRYTASGAVIMHPRYGTGQVLEPEEGDKPGMVRVRFADVGVKVLSVDWVAKNCRYL